MTIPTNWPDPTRPGYHWLKCKTEENSELEIFHWDMETQMFSGIGDVGCVDEVCFSEHWEYHGPALTPTQISEMLAAERKRCAKVCDAIATSASNEWKPTAYDSDNRARDAAEETAEICAQKIRNLGAAL